MGFSTPLGGFPGGGNAGLPVLTLNADPQVTPTAGAISQFGTFDGGLYIHLTGSSDTDWLLLGDLTGAMPVLVLAGNPHDVETPQAGALSQFGTWGDHLYVHLTAIQDVNWLDLTATAGINVDGVTALLSGAPYAPAASVLPILTLDAVPTGTATAGAMSQFGNFAGHLYVHLTADEDTNWLPLTDLVQGLLVEALAADPTVTAAPGAVSQFGTFDGGLYIHLTGVEDTNWLKLTGLDGGGLAVLTLDAVPTGTATAGAMSQFGNFAGHLYVHLTADEDTNWLPLTDLVQGLLVEALAADPTVTAAPGAVSQFGTFDGGLYVHLTGVEDTNWLKLTGLEAGSLAILTQDPQTVGSDLPVGTLGTFTPDDSFSYNNRAYVKARDGVSSTEWLCLSDLFAVTVAADPTASAIRGQVGRLVKYGEGVFLHLTNSVDTDWLKLTALPNVLTYFLPNVANDFDPSVSGLVARVGATVGTVDGTQAWNKTGTADTAWTAIGGGS